MAKAKDEFAEFRSPDEASLDRLIAALDRAYHRPGSLMWRAFLQGLSGAFGAAVGWILIITISGFLFQALGGINLLHPVLDKIEQGIQRAQTAALRQTNQLGPQTNQQ